MFYSEKLATTFSGLARTTRVRGKNSYNNLLIQYSTYFLMLTKYFLPVILNKLLLHNILFKTPRHACMYS